MKVTMYSTYDFERNTIATANNGRHDIKFLSVPLNEETAPLSRGSDAVMLFVNDNANEAVLHTLHEGGLKHIALRCAGYNNVNIAAAKKLGISVARVPAYSPYAVAEHAVTLMLALNRKIVRANSRVHELNFSLTGLTGFDMNGKTVGIIGTGQIGAVVAKIMHGFGCHILAFDIAENESLKTNYGVKYATKELIFETADIITLHVPLMPETKYLVNKESIGLMKKGVMLINTSRGGLVNTKEVIQGLKTGQIGYLGLDVYEEEAGLFFYDRSDEILQDDTISRLLTFKNVLITSHQGFLTDTALDNIAQTTIENLNGFEKGTPLDTAIF